jgi:hypothetical protein
MLPAKSGGDKDKEKPALLESIWKRIRAHLEIERQRIYEEIKNYPRPIPACDVQFNHLLEKRAGIWQEMERMDEASRERLGPEDTFDALVELIRSSNHIDREMKEKIKAALEAVPEARSAGR